MPKSRRFDTDKSRSGDEVFMRIWVTQIHPHGGHFGHRFAIWMRGISSGAVEQFVKDKISPNISHWSPPRTMLPLAGLWLVDDFNVLMPGSLPPMSTAAAGDPLADASGSISGSAQTAPAFALPLDPEYRQHLVCVP